MRKQLMVVSVLVALGFVVGCAKPKMDDATFEQQAPAVKAAHESSADASSYFKTYTATQQQAWLKANCEAWESLDKVYNPEK